MMYEYIERKEIRMAYEKLTRSYVNGNPYIADWRFDEMIEELPAANVAPVRHGRWIDVREKRLFGDHYFLCSNCKSRNGSMISFNYCPNCGAKMQEVE